MLDVTFATNFVPGTNLRGDVSGANWTFLLPSMELERSMCLGLPSGSSLVTLASRSGQVLIVTASAAERETAQRSIRKLDIENVQLLDDPPPWPLDPETIDLFHIPGRRANRRLRRARGLATELDRVLKPGALLYCENSTAFSLRKLGVRAQRTFWLTPLTGEMHTAVPIEDRETAQLFLRESIFSPTVALHSIKRMLRLSGHGPVQAPTNGAAATAERPRSPWRKYAAVAAHGMVRISEYAEEQINRWRLAVGSAPRRGILASMRAAKIDPRPPRYLRELAEAHGTQIDDLAWGLSARGQFPSRKIVFFLLERGSARPKFVVKLPRDPNLNHRVENEQKALEHLREHNLVDPELVPRSAWFGHHAGLAILGQTAVNGPPLTSATDATANCPLGRAAVEFLLRLGADSADHRASAGEVRDRLDSLLAQFAELYHPTDEEHHFLAEQISVFGRAGMFATTVFQHGDPGAWNAVALPNGRVGFLDWEAAELAGAPLWDLFYFLRSYCVLAARKAKVQTPLEGLQRFFLAESSLTSWLVDAVTRYRDLVGVPAEHVGPLFYTCWIHRALKEATRLPPTGLDRGHYFNLLKLCIRQRHSGTLPRMLSTSRST